LQINLSKKRNLLEIKVNQQIKKEDIQQVSLPLLGEGKGVENYFCSLRAGEV